MISYLVFSTVSMSVLLLFYHTVLEQEKIHHFNRGFLIFALVFSLIVPLMPVGIFSSAPLMNGSESVITPEILPAEALTDSQLNDQSVSSTTTYSSFTLSNFLFWLSILIYCSATIFLFIRFLRITDMIQLKAKRHRLTSYMGTEVVLHDEKTLPYTFLKTIYVNRDQYRNGSITPEVLRHEMAHVRQLHSLDILFIECLKIVLWFNPVLYFYKKAILLNHEFLADQAVLSNGAGITSYQKLLFDSLQMQPPHGLSSNFSYSITKKRFTMMTKTHSRFRSALKMMLPVPLIVMLALLFGCESTSSNIADVPTAKDEISIEITENDLIKLNGKELQIEELNTYLSNLPGPPELVHLKVSPEVTFGLITDVQQVLRKNDALRINYKTSRSDSDTSSPAETDRLTDDYLDSVNVYLNLPPADLNELEDAYGNLIQVYDSLKTSLKQIPDAPPPPPFPPSPQERINQELSEPDKPDQPSPPPPIETRNLIQISISSDGTVFLNDTPIPVDEVLPHLTDFIENPDNDSNLSESPGDAIIAIKTVRNTPYDIYLETLDQVMQTYDQLRENAAIERYGVSYSSLSEGSTQKEAIDSAYPKRISIAEPRD